MDELENKVQSDSKKVTKLEQEKKKHAAAKKFKDAGKCQSEIKEIQSQIEFSTA